MTVVVFGVTIGLLTSLLSDMLLLAASTLRPSSGSAPHHPLPQPLNSVATW
jgi:hypothetical protein